MKALSLLLALTLTGCTTTGAYLDAGLERAENVSEELTSRALSLLCNRISVRQWRETFRTADQVDAWRALCGHVAAVPTLERSE